MLTTAAIRSPTTQATNGPTLTFTSFCKLCNLCSSLLIDGCYLHIVKRKNLYRKCVLAAIYNTKDVNKDSNYE